MKLQEDSLQLEASAATILNFQIAGIPGLLQVPEYARRVFAAGHPVGQPDIAAAVAARMNRQAILYDDSKHLEFILTEAAVRWRLGPENLMRAQVDKIIDVSRPGKRDNRDHPPRGRGRCVARSRVQHPRGPGRQRRPGGARRDADQTA